MKVALGSTSVDKKNILTEALVGMVEDLEVLQTDVDTGIANQPFDEETTVIGAINRARNALLKQPGVILAFGLEGGLHKVNGRGYFLVCAAAIVDHDKNVFLGIGSKLQLPEEVSRKIDRGEQFGVVIREYQKKYQKDKNSQQFISRFVTRKESFFEAIRNAYTSYVNKNHYLSLR